MSGGKDRVQHGLVGIIALEGLRSTRHRPVYVGRSAQRSPGVDPLRIAHLLKHVHEMSYTHLRCNSKYRLSLLCSFPNFITMASAAPAGGPLLNFLGHALLEVSLYITFFAVGFVVCIFTLLGAGYQQSRNES